MRITFLLLLIANVTLCQSAADSKYSIDYMLEVLQAGRNKITISAEEGTKRAIKEIASNYKGEAQQKELIYFYKSVYDYKIVDRMVLDQLIDSLTQTGLTAEIKSEAKEGKNFVFYRILGKKMRDFEFPDKAGKLVRLSSLSDKMVVVELWASWCAPCIKEMPLIPEVRSTNPNVEFYSISFDYKPADMKKFLDKKKYSWPIVFGGYNNKELLEYLHVVGIPKYYTVDRNGIVINVADHLDKDYLLGLK